MRKAKRWTDTNAAGGRNMQDQEGTPLRQVHLPQQTERLTVCIACRQLQLRQLVRQLCRLRLQLQRLLQPCAGQNGRVN